jgi:hypothetical protein
MEGWGLCRTADGTDAETTVLATGGEADPRARVEGLQTEFLRSPSGKVLGCSPHTTGFPNLGFLATPGRVAGKAIVTDI